MHLLWGGLLIVAGLFMLINSLLKSDFVVYRLLVYRAKMLWGKHVHLFFNVVGVIVIIFGILVLIRII